MDSSLSERMRTTEGTRRRKEENREERRERRKLLCSSSIHCRRTPISRTTKLLDKIKCSEIDTMKQKRESDVH
jgi:hypothetical protein